MAQSSAEQMRRWQGPALFSYGFRPFFLFGAVWSAFAMVLWVAVLSGVTHLPSRFDPVSWHAHAFLFGYVGAVIAGFLLTAVPNWTGRLPVVGRHLALLFGLWVAGRAGVLFSVHLPAYLAAALDLSFPAALGAMILREIVAGRNWRNLPVLGLLTVFIFANLIFHIEAANGGIAAQGFGLRLGLATVVMLLSLIGGRIVPSFTRNWLVQNAIPARPAAPMQRFDKAVLLASLVILVSWVLRPESDLAGAMLILLGGLHLARLARWRGHRTGTEPLVWVLHAAYAFIPLGAVLHGLAILAPGAIDTTGAQHLWMAGAFGLMTLAVMTRATLGHTGQTLHAGAGTTAIYLCLIGSCLARVVAGLWPETALYDLSALLWIAAFAGFAALYGPLLLLRRKAAP